MICCNQGCPQETTSPIPLCLQYHAFLFSLYPSIILEPFWPCIQPYHLSRTSAPFAPLVGLALVVTNSVTTVVDSVLTVQNSKFCQRYT